MATKEMNTMNTTNDQTTYICLFHAHNQAEAAVRDLMDAGIPQASIGIISKSGESGTSVATTAAMEQWRVPEADAKHLMNEVNKGGILVALRGRADMDSKIEAVFTKHQAKQIDEAETTPRQQPAVAETRHAATAPVASAPVANNEGVINVVEEDIVVGKHAVQTGGVRIFSRIVETPVAESVSLREEHVHVERHPVDRPINAQSGDLFRERSVELTETAEEAVVSKTARVVEEISVGKETTQHTERVQDTVRHTEVEVEQIGPDGADGNVKAKKTAK